jgi:hypothetical protein
VDAPVRPDDGLTHVPREVSLMIGRRMVVVGASGDERDRAAGRRILDQSS